MAKKKKKVSKKASKRQASVNTKKKTSKKASKRQATVIAKKKTKKKAKKKTKKKTSVLSTKNKLLKECKSINAERRCECKPKSLSCLPAKEWVISQLGVWRFNYTKKDIRDKKVHPATFPVSLPTKIINLLTHENGLVVDPFVGAGTTLLAAQETGRNGVGFDLNKDYVKLSNSRLKQQQLFSPSQYLKAINDDARNISDYFDNESIDLIVTSPPYANLLNKQRTNKSRRLRKNEQYLKIEQYSQNKNDLGILEVNDFSVAIEDIFKSMLPLLKHKAHCVIDVPDFWLDNKRITLHIHVVEAMRKAGYELRNTIIWDRTNIVNQVGIFGYPSNYITMGTTFEYLLDFWRPE